MRIKLINGVVPPLLGILTVLALLIIVSLLFNDNTCLNCLVQDNTGFYLFFVPASFILAVILQFSLTLPVLKRFEAGKRTAGLKKIPFTAAVIMLCGLVFGLLFWEEPLSLTELIYSTTTGIIVSAIYWTIDLLTVQFFNLYLRSH